jgi:F-type H+-transporting ATPase subunit delta
MRDTTIARNYAETLLVLAGRTNDLRGWGALITDLSDAMGQNPKLRLFLESPRVGAAEKNAVLSKALTTRTPRNFLRFVQSLVTHRRQMLMRARRRMRIRPRSPRSSRGCSRRTSSRMSRSIQRSWAA